jgi:acyl-CoA thioesterase
MTEHSSKTLSPDQIIEAVMKKDFAAQAMGIKLEGVAEGYAKLSMLVRHDMLNGLALCHGGIIFALADTAFAYACNSRNRRTVALQCTINFINSAAEGDTLFAEAREISLKGRTGVYDIAISNGKGQAVAEFRGTSYGTSGETVEL